MANTIRIKRGTNAALTALASGNSLVAGELYLITDQARVAVATSTNSFTPLAKQSEAGGAGADYSFDAGSGVSTSGSVPGFSFTGLYEGQGPSMVLHGDGAWRKMHSDGVEVIDSGEFQNLNPALTLLTQVLGDIDSKLNVFNTTTKGVVPISPGGITTFLRADGTWAAAGEGSYTFTNTARIYGRNTAGGGAGEELTGAQAANILPIFGQGSKGVIAGPGLYSIELNRFLREDGVWGTTPAPAQYTYEAGFGQGLAGMVPGEDFSSRLEPTDSLFLRADGTWNTPKTTRSITFVIDGGGVAIAPGFKGVLEVPFGCTIVGWTLLADVVGSITLDVWKDTYINYPPTVADSITSSSKPTITNSNKAQNASVAGVWSQIISEGDILAFNVDSAATITRATLTLKVTV